MKNKLYIAYILLVISLFIGVDTLPFRGEESRRFLMAFEMFFSKDYFNPTVLGEDYFNKPPLFGIVIAQIFHVLGFSEFALRVISLISSILSSVFAGYVSFLITRDKTASILTAVIFLSAIDILFWYGFLAEIDMFFTLLVNISIFTFLYSVKNNNLLLSIGSGIFAGLGFLSKGFPIFLFAGTFVISLLFTHRDKIKPIFIHTFLAVFSFSIVCLIWFLNLKHPDLYIQRLFDESFSRVENPKSFLLDILDDFKFVLTTLKQFFPWSLVLVLLLFRSKLNTDFSFQSLKFLYIWVGLSYAIFLLLTDSAGRYILPLYPAISIIVSVILIKNRSDWLNKIIYLVLLIAFIRIVAGLILPDIYIERKGNLKSYANSIVKVVDNKRLVCDCHSKYEVCAYIDMVYRKPVYSSKVRQDFDFKVSCEREEELKAVQTFKIGKDNFYLYIK